MLTLRHMLKVSRLRAMCKQGIFDPYMHDVRGIRRNRFYKIDPDTGDRILVRRKLNNQGGEEYGR